MPYDVDIDVQADLPSPEAEALETLLGWALGFLRVRDGSAVGVLIADDERLRDLNRAHRGVDAPTDVLSFPSAEGEPFPGEVDAADEAYLGDVAISLPAVRRQAEEAAADFSQELAHVALHGLLHLLGYDHETPEEEARMHSREERVLGPAIHAGRRDHAHD